MTPLVAAEHLTKWYGRRLAVDRVSLSIEAGEIMGLLGPNGSGKTTILRILAGYLRPSAGTARIAGLDIVDDSLAARRRIGYVPEDAPLYGNMTVADFLGFMGRLKGLAAADLTGAVGVSMNRLGLAHVRTMQISKLSRGYRQRVAIAQALLGDPALLILDEPSNGLDPRQIIEMRDLIRSLGGERTVVVTSHILGEIERVADRAAILLDGRLLGVHALRGSSRVQRLRLRITGDETAVHACLVRVPGVAAIDAEARESGTLTATYVVSADASVAERLATAVVTNGFGLVGMEPAPVDLEALFLRLTSDRREATR